MGAKDQRLNECLISNVIKNQLEIIDAIKKQRRKQSMGAACVSIRNGKPEKVWIFQVYDDSGVIGYEYVDMQFMTHNQIDVEILNNCECGDC